MPEKDLISKQLLQRLLIGFGTRLFDLDIVEAELLSNEQERMEVNAGGWRLYDRKATRGKWGGLLATLVVAGSIQSPHSSALMTYDDA